jgi:cysteine synthase
VAGSAIFGTPRHAYKMTGLGLSFIPPNFDPEVLDAAYSVEDGLAFSVCHAIAQREGMLLGASTGAIVAAALADVQRFSSPQTMLLLNPDRGDRYLETVYNADWLNQHKLTMLQDSNLAQAIQALVSVPLTVVRGPAL